MTGREHIESVLRGEPQKTTPKAFRLDLWYNRHRAADSLPEAVRGMTLREVEKFLGLYHSARKAVVYTSDFAPPASHDLTQEGESIIETWRVGDRSLRRVQRLTPEDRASGIRPTIVKHPVQTVEDLRTWKELASHIRFTPVYEDYNRYDAETGGDGLPMTVVGPIPFHDLLINWAGYQEGYILLHEHPAEFRDAVEAANEAYQSLWNLLAASPTRLILHGVNFDSMMTPRPVFAEHFLPYLRAFCRRMHEAGKKVACHTDGDMSNLLDVSLEVGFDVADCLTCRPMVNCSFDEAYAAWKDRITVWGGVPSGLLEPRIPLRQLQEHLESIRKSLGPDKRRFILGLADQAMPSSSWEHIQCAAKFEL